MELRHDTSMRIEDILRHSPLSSLETEVLLASLLAKERTWVWTHPEAQLSKNQEERWRAWMERRGKGEPVAYITQEREFFGRMFSVDRRVLIPRPATEGLISVAQAWLKKPANNTTEIDAGIVAVAKVLHVAEHIRTVVDVGTGSGCIAISLACEDPTLTVLATDISEDALDVARTNAKRHGVDTRIRFLQGNLLDPVSDLLEPFLLISNPPYVPSERTLSPDVDRFEPSIAIRAGADGMDVIRPLLEAARRHPSCCGFILECEEAQIPLLEEILNS